jgi:hypothetical protein
LAAALPMEPVAAPLLPPGVTPDLVETWRPRAARRR